MMLVRYSFLGGVNGGSSARCCFKTRNEQLQLVRPLKREKRTVIKNHVLLFSLFLPSADETKSKHVVNEIFKVKQKSLCHAHRNLSLSSAGPWVGCGIFDLFFLGKNTTERSGSDFFNNCK